MDPDLPNYSPETSFTAKQHQALSLLAEGYSQNEISQEIGVHRNTIRNWRRINPTFAREWEIGEWERIQLWREHAIESGPFASQTLLDALRHDGVSPSVRVRAAIAILKIASEPRQPPPHSLTAPHAVSQPAVARPEIAAPAPAAEESLPPAVHSDAKNENHAQSCTTAPRTVPRKPGPNQPCSCGSGQKWKRCCGNVLLARAA